MGRLVDEDDVLKVLCRELCHPGAICPDRYCEEMRERLKDVPTAHPELPKMGKWVNDRGLYKCSRCKQYWAVWWAVSMPIERMRKEMPYCPMCGSYNGE